MPGDPCLEVFYIMPPITLIAHRGYPQRYPENTMCGFQSAVDAGATWLETDIQLSRDLQPILYHDGTLDRTSNQTGHPWDYDVDQLRRIGAAEQRRFGDRFIGQPIPTLEEFVDWAERVAAGDPATNLQLLVELKQESLAQFGIPVTIEQVMCRLSSVLHQCTIISKQIDCLPAARDWSRSDGACVRIGWVLPAWNDTIHQRAIDLAPDLLICNHQRLPSPPAVLWPGPWRWMAYTIDDAALANSIVSRGIHLIETNDIGTMNSRLHRSK